MGVFMGEMKESFTGIIQEYSDLLNRIEAVYGEIKRSDDTDILFYEGINKAKQFKNDLEYIIRTI